jgi:hypothetical protein
MSMETPLESPNKNYHIKYTQMHECHGDTYIQQYIESLNCMHQLNTIDIYNNLAIMCST